MNDKLMIERLQTDNLGITLSPRIASTNLKEFFIKRGRPLLHKMRHGSALRVGEKGDFSNKMPKHLIVLTRSERRRWCSGVLQEIPAYSISNNYERGYYGKESLESILDREADNIGGKGCIFHNVYSHLGDGGYQRHLIQLLERKNTLFCDISKLSEDVFWEYICELDPTWPKMSEWIKSWLLISNGIYGPDIAENNIHAKRTQFVNVIEDMLRNDKRLSFIKNILDKSERNLIEIRKTDRWLDVEEDKIVFAQYIKYVGKSG